MPKMFKGGGSDRPGANVTGPGRGAAPPSTRPSPRGGAGKGGKPSGSSGGEPDPQSRYTWTGGRVVPSGPPLDIGWLHRPHGALVVAMIDSPEDAEVNFSLYFDPVEPMEISRIDD